MKTLRILGRVLLVTVVSFAFTGGFVHLDQAFGACGTCPTNPVNITSCAQCKDCNIDLNHDGKVTTSDLLLVTRCITPLSNTCRSTNYPAYDTNCDLSGSVDPNDMLTVYKCLGCSVTPSPFK